MTLSMSLVSLLWTTDSLELFLISQDLKQNQTNTTKQQ